MNKIIGVIIGAFVVYFAMFLSATGAGVTMMGYLDTVSFLFVFGVTYGGMVAAYGTFVPDLKGFELMNKLIVPAGWLGTIIGWIMMFYGVGEAALEYNSDEWYRMFSLSMAVSIITLLYAFLLKVVFTIIIASKK